MRERAADLRDAKRGITLRGALEYGRACLAARGIDDAQTDAWLLLEYVTGISRARYLAERETALAEADWHRYRKLLERRAARIPLQYLTGEQEFMGLPFLVNEHVLIPRQDTETLAETALGFVRPGMRILDLCTGSGCLAVSLAKLACGGAQSVTVDGADLSPEALAVARENARRLGARVRWIQSDLFAAIDGVYDMIVSNPPYIRTEEIEGLADEVRLHEPRLALDGSADGLHFYREIVRESARHLRPGGRLLFEIGCDQRQAVERLLAEAGFAEIAAVRDLAGLDRVVHGIWQEGIHV